MNEMDLFPELSEQEIDAIFAAYIEREVDDVPSDIFFPTSLDKCAIMAEPDEPLVHEVEIESESDATLVLHPPKDGSLPFTVDGDEIILDDYRIRLRWVGH